MQENNRNSKGNRRTVCQEGWRWIPCPALQAGGTAVFRWMRYCGAVRWRAPTGTVCGAGFGVLERQTTLDFLAEQLSARPPEQLDLPVLLALRLGLYQLIYMDRVPDYAAIGETVSLVPLPRRGLRQCGTARVPAPGGTAGR